jgi:hypothetical protein
MEAAKHTPGPWKLDSDTPFHRNRVWTRDMRPIVNLCSVGMGPSDIDPEAQANARLIAAAPDLYEAARLLEAAEDFNANCPECDGEGVPELCPACFPLFDNARLARRAAIAKANGEQPILSTSEGEG